MDFSSIPSLVSRAMQLQLQSGPIILLQTAGLVGVLSAILIIRNGTVLSKHLGLILGFSNFLMAAILAEWLQGPIKPYLRNDLLFIAGFFGGWKNAHIAVLLTALGRILFGGTNNIPLALIDISFIAYSAVIISKFFKHKTIENISHKSIAKIILIRPLAVISPLVFVYFIDIGISTPSKQELMHLIILRIHSNFLNSIVIMYGVIFLLKREILRDKQLYIDTLSSLPNRRALKQDISQAVNQVQREPKILLLIEIENFYELVQAHSHDWADNYLQKLAIRLKQEAQSSEFAHYQPKIYCFSDRSFVVVLHNLSLTQLQNEKLAEALLNQLMIISHSLEHSLQAHLMIGVIEVDIENEASSSWFLRALSSMNMTWPQPIHYFESNISRQMELDNRLRLQIEEWIKNGAVPLWLQPQISLENGYCLGAEALLRAQDKKRPDRPIPPPHVLAIALKHHLLPALEWAAIKTVIRQLTQLPPELQSLKLSVNLSPTALLEPDFADKVCEMLAQKGLSGRQLTIEIIETTKLAITEVVEHNVATLLENNISLSLDDFGTGYASLSLLTKLPFDELKLDYSMTSDLQSPRTQSAIMLSIDSARRYAATVVAEGIETETQRQTLLQMGIRVGQGFLFARALPFAEFVQYAQKHALPSVTSPSPPPYNMELGSCTDSQI